MDSSPPESKSKGAVRRRISHTRQAVVDQLQRTALEIIQAKSRSIRKVNHGAKHRGFTPPVQSTSPKSEVTLVDRTRNLELEKREKEVVMDGKKSGNIPKYYSILIAKRTTKKHKTWEGDGFLVVEGISVTIISGETRKTSQKLKLPTEIIPGETEFLWEGKVILIQDFATASEVASYAASKHEELAQEDLCEQGRVLHLNKKAEENSLIQSIEVDRMDVPERSYGILIAKRTTRKHKTWEEDGVMTIDGNRITITIGDQIKSNPKLKVPAEIIPGETEISWGEKIILVDRVLDE